MNPQKTIRLFVSSTFSDFKAERNFFQEKVFPKLRELCQSFGARLQVIDLRWGVSEEAGLDQRTIQICLDEIARCQRISPRPNFVILLGDRYGWQPIPEQIEKQEFIQIEKELRKTNSQAADLLMQWYILDQNAIPEIFYLKPRKGVFRNYDQWADLEDELRISIRNAAKKAIIEKQKLQKYFLSATGQEIMHGVLSPPKELPNPTEHVFCFIRTIDNLPIGRDAFLAKDFIDLDRKSAHDLEASKLLRQIRHNLQKALPRNIFHYYSSWKEDTITLDHLPHFCGDIQEQLSGIIQSQLRTLNEKSELEAEIELHETFMLERIEYFVGRENIISDVLHYTETIVSNTISSSLVIHGPGGTGKSSLMARLCHDIRKTQKYSLIGYRFIGISSLSSGGKELLNSLCQQIARHYNWSEYRTPSTFAEQSDLFQKSLTLATATKPMIIVLDALDQLADADNARKLDWFPVKLPPHVKMIVSTLPGECLITLKTLLPHSGFLKIDKLSPAEGEQIMNAWLSAAGRALQTQQLEEVLNHFSGQGRPLYLKIAFEEIKHWRSDDRSRLVPGINAMIKKLFNRLAMEPNHGFMMVSRSLGYLASAKNGLAEDELLDLLSLDQEMWEAFRKRSPKSPATDKLPVVIWSRLYFDLEPFLVERNADGASLLGFFHRQFGQMARNLFLQEPLKTKLHTAMADYYLKQHYYLDGNSCKIPNLRKLSELPYHLKQGAMDQPMANLLSDSFYYQAKIQAGQSLDLFDELYYIYSRLQETQPEIVPDKDKKPADLGLALFRFLVSLGSITHKSLSLEDIHASLIYRSAKGLTNQGIYLEFLNLGSNKVIRDKYCKGNPELATDIEITFTIRVANMQRREGNLKGAREKYDSIKPLITIRKHLRQELARVYYDTGYISYLSGDFSNALKDIFHSADVSLQAGDETGHWISRVVGGYIKSLAYLGTPEHQERLLEYMDTLNQAYEVFARTRSVNTTAERFVMNCNAHRLIACFHLRDYKAYKRFYEALVNDPWSARQRKSEKHLVARARLAMLRGRNDLAANYLTEFIEPAEKSGNAFYKWEAYSQNYYLLGMAYADNHKYSAAVDAWQRGLEFPDEPGHHTWKRMIKNEMKKFTKLFFK